MLLSPVHLSITSSCIDLVITRFIRVIQNYAKLYWIPQSSRGMTGVIENTLLSNGYPVFFASKFDFYHEKLLDLCSR
jgi:hypothetical protein